MKTESALHRDEAALQKTATRLIDALGVEGAIFVCRSNYWHGLLRLITDRSVSGLAA